MAAKTNKPMRPQVKRYHWYAVVLFIMGTLFPPLAVAARFGIGKDFWINLFLTICGYIPGHGHNFYIQNIRNNKNHRRTPKWAQRYGLVDTSTIKRHEQRSQWAGRYNDRNPYSTYDDQLLEEGQVGPSRTLAQDSAEGTGNNLWRHDDESYYAADREGSIQTSESAGGRWRYPANFEDTLPGAGDAAGKKKKKKKDRWARTEDAYAAQEQKKRKKKKSKNRSTVGSGGEVDSTYSQRSESTTEAEVPEDANGEGYRTRRERDTTAGNGHTANTQENEFSHEF